LWWYALGALIAAHRQDGRALATHLRSAAELHVDLRLARVNVARLGIARAMVAEGEGRPDAALAEFVDACTDPDTTPESPTPAEDCRGWLPDLVRLALARDRRDVAEVYTAACAADARVDGRTETVAVARHCAGLLADDPAILDAAIEEYGRAGLAPFRAQAQENLAVLLAGRGHLDAAQRAYDAAAETYVALEAAWDLRRAEVRLRPLGVRLSRYRIRRRPASGWQALTPAELTVADLVADGLSNPEVATRLHVSRRTVETHVAHILAKLGGRSRQEIAKARPKPATSQ
jgi:DNA-binding CsgD family transcriptional regulator